MAAGLVTNNYSLVIVYLGNFPDERVTIVHDTHLTLVQMWTDTPLVTRVLGDCAATATVS